MTYSSDVDQLPTTEEIIEALTSLKGPLKKMQYRDLATEQWPEHEGHIRLSREQFDRRVTEASNVAGMAPASGQPSAEEVIGIKWADKIDCFVHEDATDSQIEEIWSTGTSAIEERIGELTRDFVLLLDDERLSALDSTAFGMSRVEAGFRELSDTEGHGHFAKIEEGTSEDQWQGVDGEKAREQLGERLGRAGEFHSNMARALAETAVEVAAQESRIYTELGSAVNEAADRVEELTAIPAKKVPLLQSFSLTIGGASLMAEFTGPVGWVVSGVGFFSGIAASEIGDVEIPLSPEIENIMTSEQADDIILALEAAHLDASNIYEKEIERLNSELGDSFSPYYNYRDNLDLIPGQGY